MGNYTTFNTKARAKGQWNIIFAYLAPDLEPALRTPGKHVPCPIHHGKDGFRVFKDVAETGGAVCNTCGAFSDGFKTLEWLNGWNFKESCEQIDSFLGHGEPPRNLPPKATSVAIPQKDNVNQWKLDRLQQYWEQSIPIKLFEDAPLIERYLRNRGIALATVPENIRFHPKAEYWEENFLINHYPAIIGVIKNIAGQTLGLHFTYLVERLGLKAPVECPKKIMVAAKGASKGCAIQLCTPITSTLAVAEGIETALAYYASTGIAAWACINAGGLSEVKIPSFINSLIILADKDRSEAGLRAAMALKSRYSAIDVEILLPTDPIPDGEKSLDWADILGAK